MTTFRKNCVEKFKKVVEASHSIGGVIKTEKIKVKIKFRCFDDFSTTIKNIFTKFFDTSFLKNDHFSMTFESQNRKKIKHIIYKETQDKVRPNEKRWK